MTPAELAKARLGNNANGAGTSSGIGIKRRLMEGVKKEEEDAVLPQEAQKKQKTAEKQSNAAPALLKPKVKQEELEDGEIGVELPAVSGDEAMQGVEYTSKANTTAASMMNGNGTSHAMQKSDSAMSNASAPATASNGRSGGASGGGASSAAQGGNTQQPPVRPAGAPTLVPPKKPSANSMFIPRKVSLAYNLL